MSEKKIHLQEFLSEGSNKDLLVMMGVFTALSAYFMNNLKNTSSNGDPSSYFIVSSSFLLAIILGLVVINNINKIEEESRSFSLTIFYIMFMFLMFGLLMYFYNNFKLFANLIIESFIAIFVLGLGLIVLPPIIKKLRFGSWKTRIVNLMLIGVSVVIFISSEQIICGYLSEFISLCFSVRIFLSLLVLLVLALILHSVFHNSR